MRAYRELAGRLFEAGPDDLRVLGVAPDEAGQKGIAVGREDEDGKEILLAALLHDLVSTVDLDFEDDVMGVDMRPFVLEGGSIDSDGQGTLLTTTECLCSMNRNEYLDKAEIENELKTAFGLDRVLWLDFGQIIGDDTDSHVDTLARFCSPDTIAYVSCEDINDPQYEEFSSMMLQLQSFRTPDGKPYRLVPLPFADPIYLDGYRLPATYANFLIINGAVLVPGTGSPKDETARKTLQEVFPDREVIVVDCRALLSGHGALHCITMQYPKGFIRMK